MRQVLFVDIDGTLNDMTSVFLQKAYERGWIHSPNIPVKGWGLEDLFDAKLSIEKREEMVNEIFCEKGFWYKLPVLPYAQKVMRKLIYSYDTYIVTSPWYDSKTCLEEKKEWVQDFFPFFPIKNLIFCNNKLLLKGNYIIDDKPSTIEGFKGTGILFNQSYNQSTVAHYKVDDWLDIQFLLLTDAIL